MEQREEEYNDDDEEMELEDEKMEEDVTILPGNPKKRKAKEDMPLERRSDETLEIHGPSPSLSSP